MPKTRKSYTSAKKLEIVAFAEINGNRPAAEAFECDEKSVREWKKLKPVLEAMDPRKRARRYRKEFWPELETELKDWVLSKRGADRKVSTVLIQKEGIKIAKRLNINDFSGSHQWCDSFMKRHGLSVRAKTSVGQHLPVDWKEKMVVFKQFVDKHKSGIDLQHIGNMDEVPVSFDMVGNHTVDQIGAEDIKIVTTGNEKSCFTVILCVTADGGKCPPFVIFKRKTLPKEDFPKGVVVRVNEKGWVNQEVISDWLKMVWNGRKNAFFTPKDKSLLIWDSAKPHITDDVKSIVKCHSKLAVIPGGLTKKLQPLDLSVNKSFKSKLKDKWEECMSGEEHTFTKSGNQRRASYAQTCLWIEEAWDDITTDCIKNGFRKAGICYKKSSDSSSTETNIESNEELSENEELVPAMSSTAISDVIELSESDPNNNFEGF